MVIVEVVVVVEEGTVEDRAVRIMDIGGLLGAHLIEVGVITLVITLLLPDILLMVEDRGGIGPGHIRLPGTALKEKETTHVVLGDI